jgi:hypothetical protein
MIQGCLFGSFTAFWTILALQLSARYHLGAETAGLFGNCRRGWDSLRTNSRIADRRGPTDLISGVILLDFGEQGALVSNEQVIYALRPEARNRLNTIFM